MKLTRQDIEQNGHYRNDGDSLTGRSHNTSQHTHPKQSLKALTRSRYRAMSDHERLIVAALYDAQAPLSRAEICRAIRRAKAPAIIALIESLVERGLIARTHIIRPNGAVMFFYEVSQ